MDKLLNDAPALAYLKHTKVWLAVNHWGEPISWTDEPEEAVWLSLWVQGYQEQLERADNLHGPTLGIGSRTLRSRPIRPGRENPTNDPGRIAPNDEKLKFPRRPNTFSKVLPIRKA